MSPTEDAPRVPTEGPSSTQRVATPPGPNEDLTGQCIAGRYQLQQLVGVGPIGQVYRAARSTDGLQVAVKVLHERHQADPNVVRRFEREALAASQLDHPNIARVWEHGVDAGGRSFLCREWVAGVPITTALAAGPLTLRRIFSPLCQALSALSEAHRRGVLHLGLKPSNLLVIESPTDELVTKVCDFGMAKLLKPVPNTLTTKYGAICAVAEYAAPEQAVPGEIDGRADVYAMGVVFYELLTGEVPFRGGSQAAVLAKHQNEPVVPPRKLRADRPIPREVENICLKALGKQLSERYQSPHELRSVLHAMLQLLSTRADLPIEAPEAPNPGLHRVSKDRLTMPGEQLRSGQKIGIGAALLLLVCSVMWLSAPNDEQENRGMPDVALEAFAEGKRQLSRGDPKGAVEKLSRAQQVLGETPEVARWLGEALLRSGERERGEALLQRYLRLVPEAADREAVHALLSRQAATQ